MYITAQDLDIQFWTNLLSISTRFFFDKARERAIRVLSNSATPVHKIYLAQKYDIPQWLQSARKQLCARRRPLEIWEAEQVGLDNTVLLAQAREILRDESQRVPRELVWPPSPEPALPANFSRSPSPPPAYENRRVSWAVNQVFGETQED
jgi:hypothetical protein